MINLCLLLLPVVVLILVQANYQFQFETPAQEEQTGRFIIYDIEQIYLLEEWQQSASEGNEVWLSVSLRLPVAEQIYKIHLDGLQSPFEFYVNEQLIQSIATYENKKRIQFYAPEQQVDIVVKVSTEAEKVSFLKTPLISHVETMDYIELKEYVSVGFTLMLLCILAIYTLVLYFTKQRAIMFLYISSYLMLLAATLFLAGEQLGQALFPEIPSIIFLKLKTTFALIGAVMLYLLLGVLQKKSSKIKKAALISSMLVLISCIYFVPETSLKLLDSIIWLSILLFLISQLVRMLQYMYKTRSFTYKNVVLFLCFVFLGIYMGLRIYYAFFGTNLPTHYYLIVFSIYMFLFVILQTNQLIKELEASRIAYFNAQIKPHFIYNALTNIISLCYTDNRRAAKLVGNFSTYLRLIFENSHTSAMISLQEELKLIDAYVEIEKARFPNRIVYEVTVDERALFYKIPSLTIQPFVENAIRHGLFNKVEAGAVQLRITEQADALWIEIIDDGVGIEPTKLAEIQEKSYLTRGIGIQNTIQRISYIHGAKIELKSEQGKGTHISIVLPIREENYVTSSNSR